MTIIVLCGFARTGKDTAADYLVKRYGFLKYTFSSVIKDLLKQKKIRPTKGNMLDLGNTLRKEMGMDAIAILLDRKIKGYEKIVLVGPRSIEEINFFRKRFPKLKIAKLISKKEQRFERRTELDSQDRKTFFERDQKDLEDKGLKEVLDEAEYEISNDSNVDKLYTEIDQLLKKLNITN